jgi:hypothetical protein
VKRHSISFCLLLSLKSDRIFFFFCLVHGYLFVALDNRYVARQAPLYVERRDLVVDDLMRRGSRAQRLEFVDSGTASRRDRMDDDSRWSSVMDPLNHRWIHRVESRRMLS